MTSTESEANSCGSTRKSFGRGKKNGVRSNKLVKAKKGLSYKLSYSAKETGNGPLFGVSMNVQLQKDGHFVFATVGNNRVGVYECLEDGSIKILQAYSDPDSEENYYCCTWTYNDTTLDPILLVAGSKGVIRVIDPVTNDCIKHYKGHGQSINDLKIHPHDPNLLLSASKDYSLRLWNLKTDICIIIFGGVEGHRDEVLYADFHLKGHKIISCGMDHSLKIWSLDNERVAAKIKDSYEFNVEKSKKPFKTFKLHFPTFTTRDIHRNYVDCVRWYGNFVLSKSCENAIICWKPGKIENENDFELPVVNYTTDQTTTILHRFDYKNSEIWFIRFSMDREQKILALGNQVGKTYVWDLDTDDPANARFTILSAPNCTTTIRQTCLSQDGSVLICICDDASIWRWDRCDLNQDAKIATNGRG
ncbi:polycomb protein eed-A [Tetranychus urticae]|uniref:Polycomb protein esc n=1 Tax=Tetranychus urticae TaxID=32264 RepID=T1KT01_TETUR|nr:polycomb protein eed-A [Tetranychus urticae]